MAEMSNEIDALKERIKALEDKRDNHQISVLEQQIKSQKAELVLKLESSETVLNTKNEATNNRITTYKNCFNFIGITVGILIPAIGYFAGKDFIRNTVKNKAQIMLDDYKIDIDKKLDTLDKRVDNVLIKAEKKIEMAVGTIRDKIPENQIVTQSEFDKWYKRGEKAYNNKNYGDAVDYFTNALDAKPGKPARAYTLNYRGSALFRLDRENEALADFDSAIELDIPKHARPYFNKGIIYNNSHNYDEAIANLRKAIGKNPEYTDPYRVLSVVYQNKYDFKEARKILQMLENVIIGNETKSPVKEELE